VPLPALQCEVRHDAARQSSLTTEPSESALTAAKGNALGARNSCWRSDSVLDDEGKPVTFVDEHGNTVELKIGGRQYAGPKMSSGHETGKKQDVIDGGGTMVEEIDGGVPNKRFNCVGWVFRELNQGGGWFCPETGQVLSSSLTYQMAYHFLFGVVALAPNVTFRAMLLCPCFAPPAMKLLLKVCGPGMGCAPG